MDQSELASRLVHKGASDFDTGGDNSEANAIASASKRDRASAELATTQFSARSTLSIQLDPHLYTCPATSPKDPRSTDEVTHETTDGRASFWNNDLANPNSQPG